MYNVDALNFLQCYPRTTAACTNSYNVLTPFGQHFDDFVNGWKPGVRLSKAPKLFGRISGTVIHTLSCKQRSF